ncbi:chemotaxis protein CheA [Desulfonatronospira sp. MSAO_Bac3]|uniref:chemotaxis protein CheA n=1 Tax=Desulfonatronospira sp. MSAO_Bac3 TaxID=2293857 RepID=UPI000FED1FF8|nr:chemotaxis protein CheA [Desulfonatronospira sp. MSAO_Bac3]RQD74016.1 MAG: chemotaxis protein CheA [Desulfonatronospira sp. MSAO_Bac3]
MNQRFSMFVEECREVLVELEEALLKLEMTPGSPDGVNRVFRSLHTIKSSAAMLGLEDVRELSNDMETVFDLVRSGRVDSSRELITLSFRYKDLLERYLNNPDSGLPLEETAHILSSLENLVDFRQEQEETSNQIQGNDQEDMDRASYLEKQSGGKYHYHLRYTPGPKNYDLFNPMDILEELSRLGQCYTGIHQEDVPPLEELDPGVCSLSWDIVLSTHADEEAVKDVFLFLDNPGEVSIFKSISEAEAWELISALTSQTGPVPAEEGSLEVAPANPASSMNGEPGSLSAGDNSKAAGTLRKDSEVTGGANSENTASIRISTAKMDEMVDLVGQLVIAQARLKQIESELHHVDLTSVSEEVERLSNDLRERTLSMRMVPMGSTFNKFKRLVRDLSLELNKEIELKTYGAETELDKTVIEKMNDPLVHVLRNSIDHGIEEADKRQAMGKPRKGCISLSARQSAGQVNITIQDDGCGINPDRIFSKAVERGLARADDRPSDKDILQWIFHPGFSTADKVTSVSGRGVGMDVVRRSLDELKGSVEVDSEIGAGTTITIGLPLTLAIIEGLMVMVDQEYYIIPLSDVVECVEVSRKNQQKHHVTMTCDIRGQLMPCINVRNWYQAGTEAPEIEQAVIVQAGLRRFGLVVDSIVGQHQTVIKDLGRVFAGKKWLSGATIMGSGALALILDVPSMVKEVEQMENVRH